MGWLKRLLGGPQEPRPDGGVSSGVRPEPHAASRPRPVHRDEYLSPGAEAAHFSLDCARLTRASGRLVLSIPEGMVNPRSRSLHHHGIYVFRPRGVSYYPQQVKAAGLRPGTAVRLVREPDNEHDANAIAVHPGTGRGPLGYVNKQNAARLARRLDVGDELVAITLTGSPRGADDEPLTVLVTDPATLEQLRRR